jgi:hypothetical protein
VTTTITEQGSRGSGECRQTSSVNMLCWDCCYSVVNQNPKHNIPASGVDRPPACATAAARSDSTLLLSPSAILVVPLVPSRNRHPQAPYFWSISVPYHPTCAEIANRKHDGSGTVCVLESPQIMSMHETFQTASLMPQNTLHAAGQLGDHLKWVDRECGSAH